MAGKDVELVSGLPIKDACAIEISAKYVYEETNDIEKGTPTQFKWPSLHLLSGKDRALFFNLCVPLYNAAIKGDIGEAIHLLRKNHYHSVLSAAITEGYETILHVATGAGQIRFVQEIVKMMQPEDLMLQNIKGNTAFCFAAMNGNIQIAKILLKKNEILLTIRGGENMTPLYLAALFGQREMAKFLYPLTKQNLKDEDRRAIFLISITTSLYDIALTLLEDYKELAVARHVQYGTALHMLAQKPSAFDSRSPGLLKRIMSSFPGMKFADPNSEFMSTDQALILVQCLWKEILQRQDVVAVELIRNWGTSNLLFDAARLGNLNFLAELISSYPDLIYELDENHRSIFHISVLHGHTNIFNLICETGFGKELLATYVDKDHNNILHLAAKYQHRCSESTASDAAVEMQRELQMFQEVEKIVKPSSKEMRNSEGKTPIELFTIEHKELLRSGELSMKKTASSFAIIALLITVVMYVAAFSTSVGNNDETEIYINIRETLYQVFVVAYAVGLSCSSISMLIFLSILTTRCAEEDYLKLLPRKLLVGRIALYTSVIFMFIDFGLGFIIPYHQRLN